MTIDSCDGALRAVELFGMLVLHHHLQFDDAAQRGGNSPAVPGRDKGLVAPALPEAQQAVAVEALVRTVWAR